MPLAAVIDTALGGGVPGPQFTLTLDGLQVLKNPSAGGNTFGVPIDSVQLEEAGFGQVDSLTFELDDPVGELSVAEGMAVLMWDHTAGLPLFRGRLDSWGAVAWGVGRRITIGCIGVQSWLDDQYLPALTLAIGTDIEAGFQALVAASVGCGGFYPNCAIATSSSSRDKPIGIGLGPTITTSTAWTWAGGSLRQGLQAWADFVTADVLDWESFARIKVTIDQHGGLRVIRCPHDPTVTLPSTTDLFGPIIDKAFGNHAPANTSHGVNASGAVHAVYVKSSTPAGTGLVSDGSGLPGRTAVITDNNSTTGALRDAIGRAYLGQQSVVAAGSVDAEYAGLGPGTPGAEDRAYGTVLLTDPQAGVNGVGFYMSSISKRFVANGDEVWSIEYGGESRRASQVLRRLTAGELV